MAKKAARKKVKKASKKKASRKKAAAKKTSARKTSGARKAGKKAARKAAGRKTTKKKARRTVLYSSGGKKLYAVRKADGTFKDIQSYQRAHAMDIARSSAAEDAQMTG